MATIPPASQLLLDKFKQVNAARYPEMANRFNFLSLDNTTISDIAGTGNVKTANLLSSLLGISGKNQTWNQVNLSNVKLHDITDFSKTLAELITQNTVGLYGHDTDKLVSFVTPLAVSGKSYLTEVKQQITQHFKVVFNPEDFSVDETVPETPIVNVNSPYVFGSIEVHATSTDHPLYFAFLNYMTGRNLVTLDKDYVFPNIKNVLNGDYRTGTPHTERPTSGEVIGFPWGSHIQHSSVMPRYLQVLCWDDKMFDDILANGDEVMLTLRTYSSQGTVGLVSGTRNGYTTTRGKYGYALANAALFYCDKVVYYSRVDKKLYQYSPSNNSTERTEFVIPT